jgi:putative transposase
VGIGALEEPEGYQNSNSPKFCGPFDEVFVTEGVRVIETPIRAPRANAFAERWVETLRRECPDHLLILGRRHLEVVLRTYVGHCNAARPHCGIGLDFPEGRRPFGTPSATTTVRRRDLLSGLIHEYELAA